MKAGKLASAAHLIKQGKVSGVFDSRESWRTAILLFMPLDEIKPKKRRKSLGGAA